MANKPELKLVVDTVPLMMAFGMSISMARVKAGAVRVAGSETSATRSSENLPLNFRERVPCFTEPLNPPLLSGVSGKAPALLWPGALVAAMAFVSKNRPRYEPVIGMNGLGTKFTVSARFVCITKLMVGDEEVTAPIQLLKRFP